LQTPEKKKVKGKQRLSEVTGGEKTNRNGVYQDGRKGRKQHGRKKRGLWESKRGYEILTLMKTAAT